MQYKIFSEENLSGMQGMLFGAHCFGPLLHFLVHKSENCMLLGERELCISATGVR
jgi:hypothetical protein